MTRDTNGGGEPTTRERGPGRRAQSETIAVVLLVALTIVASVGLLTVGSSVIDATQGSANDAFVERAVVEFDARADGVVLGTSNVVEADLGDTRGFRADVREDEGWIRIVHHDANDGSDEVIYNETLGAVRLENGETSVAYQGGGVWRSDGTGSTMVTAPAFTYRDQTLTLPVVRVQGRDSSQGSVRAVVRETGRHSVPVFPNASATYADGTRYQNTLENGHVTVTVHGEYYRAWAQYWREYTTGRVSVDSSTRTAHLDLYAYGTLGRFQMPAEGEAIQVRGYAGGDALEEYSVTLVPDDTDAAEFNPLQWSMIVEEGGKQLEIHLRRGAGAGDGCDGQSVDATIYYNDTTERTYEGWHADDAFTTDCVDQDGDGEADETRLVANLTSTTTLEPTDLGKNDVLYFSPKGEEISGEPGTFAATCDDPGCAESAPIGALVGYYFDQFGMDFDIAVADRPSDGVNEQVSTGTIDYPGDGRITYLHVTEQTVTVELD